MNMRCRRPIPLRNPVFSSFLVSVLLVVPGKSLLAQAGETFDLRIPVVASASFNDRTPDVGQPASPDFVATADTNGDDTVITRSLIHFDLSMIESDWEVLTARIDLRGNPTTTRPENQGFNETRLESVTSAWDQATVNWNTQPAVTTANAVTLDQSWIAAEDYLAIDITPMFLEWVADPSTNHGIRIRLVTEGIFRSRVFASGNHLDADLWPVIQITYQVEAAEPPDTTTTGFSDAIATWEITAAPNPFIDQLTIRGDQSTAGEVVIDVFDASGRRVAGMREFRPAGDFEARLRVPDLPAGTYLVQASASDRRSVLRAVRAH